MPEQVEGKTIYHIKVKGLLDERWSDWFDGLEIVQLTNDCTLISGLIRDQSALHGLLNKIRDLGLCLLSIEKVDPNG